MSRRFRDLHTPTSDTSGPPRQEALLVDIDTVYDQDPGDDLLFPEYQRDKSPIPALLTVETQAVKNTTRPQVLGLVRGHESPCSVLDDNDDNNPDRDGGDDDDDPFSYLDELEDSAQESRDALAALGSASNPISVVSSPPRAAPNVALDEGGENDNRVFFRVDHVNRSPFFPTPPSQTEGDAFTSQRRTRSSSRNLAKLSQSQSDLVMKVISTPDPSNAFVDPLEQLDRADIKTEVESKKRALGSRVASTQRGSKRTRQSLGQPARLAITGMAASDGKVRVKGAKWPTKAEYTTKSRLGEIQCNACYGWRVPLAEQRFNGPSGHQADGAHRAHFACAGFASKKEVDETLEWVCPDCEVLQAPAFEGITSAYESRRVIRMSTKKRTLVPYADGRKREAYLIKWCDWHVKHSTWALPEQIDEPASLVATFFQACMEAHVEFNAPLALLPDTLDDWTKDGVAKDPHAYSNLDPFVDEVAEKQSK
ncbi:hypothetical protein JCM24511_04415 [Saitozyma sp. JCM 24511]|nr:hypothetical protein JCM24511_04415 [Saitozyma sp. JCM 24511]